MKKRIFAATIFIAYCVVLVKLLVFKAVSFKIGHLMFNFSGGGTGPANFVPFRTILPYLLGEKGRVIAFFWIGRKHRPAGANRFSSPVRLSEYELEKISPPRHSHRPCHWEFASVPTRGYIRCRRCAPQRPRCYGRVFVVCNLPSREAGTQ